MAEKDLYHCDLLTSNNKKCNKKYKTRQGLERHIKHKHTQVQEIKCLDMKVLESLFRKSCEKLKEDECLPDHIRKVYGNVEISSEQLEIILNELTPLVRHCHDIDSYFQHCFHLQSSKKIVLESIGTKNSALLESEVLNQLLYYLREDGNKVQNFLRKKTFQRKKLMHYNIWLAMSSISYTKNSKWQERSMNTCSIAVFY